MKKILFFLLVLLNAANVSGESFSISGIASGSEGKILHIYEYSDLLTGLQKEIAAARIDSSGNFSADPVIASTGAVILSIDFHTREIFVEPGKVYRINIAPVISSPNAEINPFIESQPLEIEFVNEDPASLNKRISDFNEVYNDFVLKNFNDLYKNRNVSLINEFRDRIKKDFADTTHPYFAGYVKYKLASLEHVSGAKGPSQIMTLYFSKPPILYRNVEYMDFFRMYFQKYILAASRPLKFQDYNSILSKAEAYPGMMKALLADTNLKRRDLRELVLIHGLSEFYHEPGFSREMILKLLREIQAKSSFDEHRIIAGNIVHDLTRLTPGTPAPEFRLADKNKKMVSLSDFRGKPVILVFWTSYCQECISTMEKLQPLAGQYGDRIGIVSISADKSFSRMNIFLKMKKNFTWTFLHIGESIDLLKDYNVKNFPLYVLVDKDGMIYDYPAPLPGEGIDTEVAGMLGR